jgi:pimeloyl-ACP methyl ester carboxylesterase
MTGGKALALEALCRESGHAFLRFDYRGHGASSGVFEDATLGAWKEDAVCVLDELSDGPQILVGSSMGGWVMLLAALARPRRIAGLVGIAPAPDFTLSLWENELSDAQKAEIEAKGVTLMANDYGDPYPITRKMIEESHRHLLLDDEIPLDCPVRLLHGMEDDAVPWQTSLTLQEKLRGADVEVTLIKDGDHRLSEDGDLARLTRTVDDLIREAG